MSDSIELALLTRVMVDGDYHSLEKARIDESYFTNEQARAVFQYLRDTFHHPQTAGQVPSAEMVRIRFPMFGGAHPYDTVPVLAAELRRERVKVELMGLSQKLNMMAAADPLGAIAELRAESSKIAALSEVGDDMSMAGAFSMLLNRYNTVSQSSGMIGIPYPWDVLNEETQGMQGSQFIIIYGRPKSMKSWVGIYLGVHAYLASRRRVLFYTREMNPSLVAQRAAAAICKVDYGAFKNGKLQPWVRKQVFDKLEELIEDEKTAGQMGLHQPYFIITTDRGAGGSAGGGGVGWLQAKIRDLKPDLVIVDGMYLMKDDRTQQRTVDWRQMAHVSQDLKLTAQQFDIPVVGITQANRAAQKSKGEDLTELAFADAFGQDADAVFRVSKHTKMDEATKTKKTELLITAPGLREGTLEGIVINGQPATDFSFIKKIINLDDVDKEGYGEKKDSPQNPVQAAAGKFQRTGFMKTPVIGKQ